MNMDVEEMPIHHSQENLQPHDIELVKSYRRHDVMATYALLYLTIGKPEKIPELNGGIPVPELDDYKDANKIEQRLDISKETGMNCMNWSDVKIGEETNKMQYMQAKKIKKDIELKPKKVVYPYGKKFKKYFPKTMNFKTDQLKNFFKDLGEKYVLAEEQEFPIIIGKTKYTVAKGGLHSNERNRVVKVDKGWILDDEDVGSQYPNSIIKLGVYPPHLDELILHQFKDTVVLKDVYKQQGKTEKANGNKSKAAKLKSLEGLTKLKMNGG